MSNKWMSVYLYLWSDSETNCSSHAAGLAREHLAHDFTEIIVHANMNKLLVYTNTFNMHYYYNGADVR